MCTMCEDHHILGIVICMCFFPWSTYQTFGTKQVINLAAICTPADYNTRPLDTIYSNFIDALPVVSWRRFSHLVALHSQPPSGRCHFWKLSFGLVKIWVQSQIQLGFLVVVVNLILLFMQVQYCRVNHKRLIHFSTCEVYGKTIGSFLPADSPLKKVPKKSNLLTNWFCELQ